MNDDEKLDKILNKMSEMESKRDNFRYYWTVGILGVIGFIVIFNIILFAVEASFVDESSNSIMIISFVTSAFVTLLVCYTLIMNRIEKSKERLSSKK
jgi:uncharacterized BrkB/YihY/UPF0761 family membrane protein